MHAFHGSKMADNIVCKWLEAQAMKATQAFPGFKCLWLMQMNAASFIPVFPSKSYIIKACP